MPRLSRQESQDVTRSRLKAAARSEIARRGLGGASIDRIVDAAGFSSGAFYSNYRSKRDLLLELLISNQVEEVRIWQELIEQATDLDTMFARMRAQFDQFANRSDWGLLAIELQLEAERDPEFCQAYQLHTADLFAKAKELLQNLLSKAGLAPLPNVEVAAVALRSLCLGLIFQNTHAVALDGHSPGEAVILFLRGILNRPEAIAPGGQS